MVMACNAEQYSLPTIHFVAGSTQEFEFHVFSAIAHLPFDLKSCTANLSVVSSINKTGAPLISKSMEIVEDDSLGSDGMANILTATLHPYETVQLCGKYIYQISIRYISGEMDIPSQGVMYITQNINKEYTAT